ncbi:MAG: alpha/beta hydrolase [Gammaproteobacteria bacterium]|nr:alpha/beta hydrolase [Gammaproteobacteria bacterium]
MINYNVDPEIQIFIDEYLKISNNLSTDTSIAQQRQSYEKICQHFCYPHPEGITSDDALVDGRHGKISIRRYYFQQPAPNQPQIIFLHGGGFILGSLDSHDDICAELCAATGFNTISIDYRLSPEFYHPVHLDDVTDAYLQVTNKRSIMVGVSAGATLSAALCHRLKNSSQLPLAQVLIYPGLGGDLFNLESYQVNAQAPLLTTDDIHFYRKSRCLKDPLPLDDAEFYPLAARDFGGLPATVAFSADIDPLRDDASFYVEQINKAGGNAKVYNEAGLIHDYLRARHTSQKAADSFRRIGEAISESGSGIRQH